MSDKEFDNLNSLLETIRPERRKFIRRGLVVAGAAVLAVPSSTLLAQQGQQGTGGKGKGKGKGQGDGTFQGGKGKGKGDGTFQGGKGKGKGANPGGQGQGPGNGKGKGKGKGSV